MKVYLIFFDEEIEFDDSFIVGAYQLLKANGLDLKDLIFTLT